MGARPRHCQQLPRQLDQLLCGYPKKCFAGTDKPEQKSTTRLNSFPAEIRQITAQLPSEVGWKAHADGVFEHCQAAGRRLSVLLVLNHSREATTDDPTCNRKGVLQAFLQHDNEEDGAHLVAIFSPRESSWQQKWRQIKINFARLVTCLTTFNYAKPSTAGKGTVKGTS